MPVWVPIVSLAIETLGPELVKLAELITASIRGGATPAPAAVTALQHGLAVHTALVKLLATAPVQ